MAFLKTSTQSRTPDHSKTVQILPSALFFTASSSVPKGIRARDLAAMVQGLVEEHSPLPIEQTSWGFLLDNKSRQHSHFLYYAAPKDISFPKASDASDPTLTAVLPGIAAFTGLHFKSATWLCLQEDDCLSLIHFAADSTVPDWVYSRFIDPESDSANCFKQRSELLAKHIASNVDPVIDGILRINSIQAKPGKEVQFTLVQSLSINAPWKPWRHTSIKTATRLVAADLRTKETLQNEHQKAQLGKHILWMVTAVVIAVITLGSFEYLQIKQSREVERLSELAKTQQALVEELQEIETMTKSLKNILQKDFRPFQWMMVLNQSRPGNLSFSSYAIDDIGSITLNGEATEVKALNTYVESMQANPKLKSFSIENLNTSTDGVTFSLKITTGDLSTETPIEEAQKPEAKTFLETPTETVTSTEEPAQ